MLTRWNLKPGRVRVEYAVFLPKNANINAVVEWLCDSIMAEATIARMMKEIGQDMGDE